MGDYTDFYEGRGKNKRVFISVIYKSGRKEKHDFGTQPAAERAVDRFKKTGVVKSARILKERKYK